MVGADANFTVFKNTDIQGFIGRSVTPGKEGNDAVGRLKYNWLSDLYEVFVEHLYIGPDFQHDVGFVRRLRHPAHRYGVHLGAAARSVSTSGISSSAARWSTLTDTHQRLLTREQIFQATSRFQNDDALRFNATETFDRVDAPFEIATGIFVPPGDYQFLDTWGEAETSGKRKVGGRFRVGGGDFYGGTRQYCADDARRGGRRRTCRSRPAYEFNDVDLPQGAFTTHVVNARMNVNLSNRWLTTTLAQYDSASQRQSSTSA